MKRTRSTPNRLCAISAALLFSLANAHAVAIFSNEVTIVSDNFSNDGALDGSLTDTGQTWSGSGWQNSNGVLEVSSSSGAKVSGISIQTNTRYRLSVNVDITAGGNNWLSLGFGDFSTDRRVWMLRRQSPEIQILGVGSSSSTFAQTITNSDAFPLNLEMVVDTGNNLSNSTARWFANDNDLGYSTPIDMAGINSIFVGNISSARGSFDDLLLTAEPIPEPNTAILTTSSLLLLLRKRRS